MTIKSLLQLILFLLIVLIIGGIYYIYFYSVPLNSQKIIDKELNIISNENPLKENNKDQDILQDVQEKDEKISTNMSQLETKELVGIQNANKNSIEKKKSQDKSSENKTSLDKIKNLTKEIEYITSNKNGDIFRILAEYGRTNIKDTNVLDLENVKGTISSLNRSTIFISSNFANYNYTNQNSTFYKNVKINYDDKIITCDNLDLVINKNIAVAYSNVLIKDDKSTMKAQIITLDIVTKDININSEDKIRIITK